MNLKNKITTLAAGLMLTSLSFGQTTKSATDYLGLAKSISFNNVSYNLTWTSHPTDNYYKQEYIAENDNIDKFKRLITIDVLVGNIKIKDAVASKIEELEKIKATNPIVNYQIFEKDDEIMLEFLLSQNTPDGKNINIVEQNVYRYKTTKDKNGQTALLLFAVSDRGYENDIQKFFANLKQQRSDLLNAVGTFEIPEITIAK